MPRSRPDPARLSPGRRPPDRYRALKHPKPHDPRGFTVPGMRQVFDAILPMRGEDRRHFFNQASTGLVLGLGLGGGLIGASWGGLVGALLGFAVGVCAAGSFVESGRFYRR